MRTLLFFIAILWAGGGILMAQTDNALLRQLAEENKKSVEALALYPEDTRLAILESAKYPEVLIKMKSAQEKTSAAFRTLIEDYPRSTQEVFFDLTRYPGLIADLAARRNDRDALRQSLEILPKAKREEALGVAERQMNTLIKINDLMRTAQGAFENMIAPYPGPAQAAFRKLLDLPEVIDILNEDLRFTVLVGDIYKENPAWVIHKMDSLNLAVARQHAEELEDWKNTVDRDPQAREEFRTAAREYADEYGYTDELYDVVNDDLYVDYEPEHLVVEHYYSYNYPYWFGYPWWAPQPCWRPYPYWWYWGFYPHHPNVVIVYLPSYHFMHWYFWHPHHHYAYNHLSTQFVNHYYGHRRSGTTISSGVGDWRTQHRDVISDEWMSDKSQLAGRLREFGRFEEARQQYNVKNPARTLSPGEFLDKNPRKYPALETSRAQAKTEIQRDRTEQDRRRSDWAPTKEPVTPEPARVPRTEKPEKIKTPPAPERREPATKDQPVKRPERPATQPTKKPEIDDAKDYHRDRWQEPKRSTPKTEPAAAPKTRQITPAPRKATPTRKEGTPPAPKTPRKREG